MRKEYRILFTNKKSPIFKVGIIEPEGILFASSMEDLKANTRTTMIPNEIPEAAAPSFSGSLDSGFGLDLKMEENNPIVRT
jgi:hypothetical protein